jgi:hypothetical protein
MKEDLKAETESEIVAAQDQALQTKFYTTKCVHGQATRLCTAKSWRQEGLTPLDCSRSWYHRHEAVHLLHNPATANKLLPDRGADFQTPATST